jgi:CBS domain containing-hemolysin-like protein
MGWLIARSTDLKRRMLSTALVGISVPGFFGDPGREAVVIAGLLLLLWVPLVPVPRFLVRTLGIVASASLFVYLVHWQVYPFLEDEQPVLATVASFAAGILAWRGYAVLTSWSTARIASLFRRRQAS